MQQSQSPEELRIHLAGGEVAALAWGPHDGVPALAVHGWLDNAASFAPIAPMLFGLRVVAVDLPGHGLSSHRPTGMSYHFVDWVTDLAAIADALGWDRFSLIGHSMGGAVCCLFAGAFPDRVERLALLEALGPLTAEPDEAPQRLADGIVRLLQSCQRPAPKPHPDRTSMVRRLREASPGLTELGATYLVDRGSVDVEGGVAWRTDRRLRNPSLLRFCRSHVLAFLDRIHCPVLLVRALQGFPVDKATVRAQLAHLSDLRFVEIEGSHHVHLDDPRRVADVLELFFASTTAHPGH